MEPIPADVSTVCPVCTATRTIDQASHHDLPDEGEGVGLQPGEVLSGFEVIEELSRGGMGVIYKAKQLGLNRLVALKVLTPDRMGHSGAMQRFIREVQAAAHLSHPNIVTVFHTDLKGPRPYLAMEYVPGIDLMKLVKRVGPLPVEESLYYIQQAAHGLQHAFERGMVHRDIKPANLIVTPSPLETTSASNPRKPTVKILDMGLARVVSAEDMTDGEAVASLTHAGEFLGTPDYISPEQAEDPRSADIRSDLYSLGGTLYFLLVGKVPMPGLNLVQKIRRLITGFAPKVSEHRSDVSPEVSDLIDKLMAREPGERFQTPADLIMAIDALPKGKGPRPQAKKAPPAPAPSSAKPSSPTPTATPLVVTAHPGGVRALSLSADGKLLLSGGQDETLRLWDAARLAETRCIAGDVGPLEDARLAPSGKWAAACALRLFKSDMVVQVWELASGQLRRRLKGPEDTIQCVDISRDSRRVAAGSVDKTVRVWSVDQPGSPSICLKGHGGPVSCVLILPAPDALLSGSQDGTVRVWNTKTGENKGVLKGQVGPVEALAAGMGQRVAMAGAGLQIRQGNGALASLRGHQGQVLCLAFSADGELLASGGEDAIVRVWRSATATEVRCFSGHGASIRAVALSPDGKTLFSGSDDGTIRRWSL